MAAQSVLVVGASRGIGAELVRQYLVAGAPVHATVRDLSDPGELSGMSEVSLHRLDVRDVDETNALAAELSGAGLAVVIHNAGVNRASRAEMMEVNAVAPIRVVESLLHAEAIDSGGAVAIMTSQMGSRGERGGSLGTYGDSKAALNDEFRARAEAWAARGVIAVVVHPGWVQTDMGGPSAPLAVEESVEGVRRLIAGLTPDHHGRFWTWDAREHAW
ncbi:MAG: SDR family NAD(P)-dependent oxidoreductase [Acidimicrobiia bacterium]